MKIIKILIVIAFIFSCQTQAHAGICQLRPLSYVERGLAVSYDDDGLTTKQITALMRDGSPDAIEQILDDINEGMAAFFRLPFKSAYAVDLRKYRQLVQQGYITIDNIAGWVDTAATARPQEDEYERSKKLVSVKRLHVIFILWHIADMGGMLNGGLTDTALDYLDRLGVDTRVEVCSMIRRNRDAQQAELAFMRPALLADYLAKLSSNKPGIWKQSSGTAEYNTGYFDRLIASTEAYLLSQSDTSIALNASENRLWAAIGNIMGEVEDAFVRAKDDVLTGDSMVELLDNGDTKGLAFRIGYAMARNITTANQAIMFCEAPIGILCAFLYSRGGSLTELYNDLIEQDTGPEIQPVLAFAFMRYLLAEGRTLDVINFARACAGDSSVAAAAAIASVYDERFTGGSLHDATAKTLFASAVRPSEALLMIAGIPVDNKFFPAAEIISDTLQKLVSSGNRPVIISSGIEAKTGPVELERATRVFFENI